MTETRDHQLEVSEPSIAHSLAAMSEERRAAVVRAVAGPIIAADRRWMADEFESSFPEGHPWRDGAVYAAMRLRTSADELDGGQP